MWCLRFPHLYLQLYLNLHLNNFVCLWIIAPHRVRQHPRDHRHHLIRTRRRAFFKFLSRQRAAILLWPLDRYFPLEVVSRTTTGIIVFVLVSVSHQTKTQLVVFNIDSMSNGKNSLFPTRDFSGYSEAPNAGRQIASVVSLASPHRFHFFTQLQVLQERK